MHLIFSLSETVSLVLRSASPNIMPEYMKELADLTSVISPVFGHCMYIHLHCLRRRYLFSFNVFFL